MNDTQILDSIRSVIDRLAPIVAVSIDSTLFQPLGEELAAVIVTLDECSYALTERIGSKSRHPSRVVIVDDESLGNIEYGNRPDLSVVKPDWLYDSDGNRRAQPGDPTDRRRG